MRRSAIIPPRAAPIGRLLPLLAVAVLLAACGGGSDDGDHDDALFPEGDAELSEPEGPEEGLRVTVVGDSITALGSAALRDELVDARLSITGVPGNRLGQFDLSALEDQDPEVLVIALGTNNIAQGGWDDDDEAELDDLLDDLGDRPCTLFVDIAVHGEVFVDGAESDVDFEDEAEIVNGLLADAARERSENGDPSRVVAWSEKVDEPGVIVEGDGIHPSAEGARVWARLIADEVRRGC